MIKGERDNWLVVTKKTYNLKADWKVRKELITVIVAHVWVCWLLVIFLLVVKWFLSI